MTDNRLKLLWLRERFQWMGQHSGYDQLCNSMIGLLPDRYQYKSIWRNRGRLPRGTHRLLTYLTGIARTSPLYDRSSALAELSAIWQSVLWKYNLLHLLYIEENLGLLAKWRNRISGKIVGTVHMPSGWWRIQHSLPQIVSVLDELIVLSSKEVAYFEQYLPGRVHFIPHGIDIDFFYPDTNPGRSGKEPRCVFCGVWMRDLETFARVVDKVLIQDPCVKFDIIVPKDRRQGPFFHRMARHDQVAWHANISDEQLRHLYRQASMLVLPLLNCTANNAVLEAIACGLPIVSNDVGGLPDYTHNSFADLLPVGDVDGFTEAVLSLVNNPSESATRSLAARAFAEENLAWDKIANQTLTVYEKVLSAKE